MKIVSLVFISLLLNLNLARAESFRFVHFAKGDIQSWSVNYPEAHQYCFRDVPPEGLKWVHVKGGWKCETLPNVQCTTGNCCNINYEFDQQISVVSKDTSTYMLPVHREVNYWSASDGFFADSELADCEAGIKGVWASNFNDTGDLFESIMNGTVARKKDKSCYLNQLDLVVETPGFTAQSWSTPEVLTACP